MGDPVKERVDEHLRKYHETINRLKAEEEPDFEIELEVLSDDQWVEIFPGQWELVPKNEIKNIFDRKESLDDDLGRPTNRP